MKLHNTLITVLLISTLTFSCTMTSPQDKALNGQLATQQLNFKMKSMEVGMNAKSVIESFLEKTNNLQNATQADHGEYKQGLTQSQRELDDLKAMNDSIKRSTNQLQSKKHHSEQQELIKQNDQTINLYQSVINESINL